MAETQCGWQALKTGKRKAEARSLCSIGLVSQRLQEPLKDFKVKRDIFKRSGSSPLSGTGQSHAFRLFVGQ